MTTATLLYDAQCGFCRRAVARVLSWDRGHRLRPLALQDPEADRLLAGMEQAQKMASWHLVTDDGRVHSGGAAFPPLFRLLPGGRVPAALTAAFPAATDRLYRAAARNRGRLGRWSRRRRNERGKESG